MSLKSVLGELATVYPAIGVGLTECSEAAETAWRAGCGQVRIRTALGPVGGLVSFTYAPGRDRVTLPEDARAAAVKNIAAASDLCRRRFAAVLTRDGVDAVRATRPFLMPLVMASENADDIAGDEVRRAHAGTRAAGPYLPSHDFRTATNAWRDVARLPRQTRSAMREMRIKMGRALAICGVPLANVGPILGMGPRYGYRFAEWARVSPAEGYELDPRVIPAVRELVSLFEDRQAADRDKLRRLRSNISA